MDDSSGKLCNKIFSTAHTLKFHVKNAHDKNPCSVCGERITNFGKNQHFKEKHLESELYMCQNCGLRLYTPESLQKHMKYKHFEEGDYPCPFAWKNCDKRYSTKDALRKHISHNHKPEMPCSTCGKLIQRSRVALHNKLAHTSMEDRKYQCPSCPKGFNFKRRLEDHINTHT